MVGSVNSSHDHDYNPALVSSATSSTIHLPTVEEAATTTGSTGQSETLNAATVNNKPAKDEAGETFGSSSTVDHNSHVSLSQQQQQQQQPWNKGMKILLGCKVGHVLLPSADGYGMHSNSQPLDSHTIRQYNKE